MQLVISYFHCRSVFIQNYINTYTNILELYCFVSLYILKVQCLGFTGT